MEQSFILMVLLAIHHEVGSTKSRFQYNWNIFVATEEKRAPNKNHAIFKNFGITAKKNEETFPMRKSGPCSNQCQFNLTQWFEPKTRTLIENYILCRFVSAVIIKITFSKEKYFFDLRNVLKADVFAGGPVFLHNIFSASLFLSAILH